MASPETLTWITENPSGRDRVSGGTHLIPTLARRDVTHDQLLQEIEALKKQNAALSHHAALSHLALKSSLEPKTQPKSQTAFPATALRRQHQTIGLLTLKDFLESQ